MSSLFVLVLMGSGMVVMPGYYDNLAACQEAGGHHYWPTSFVCIPAPAWTFDRSWAR